MAFPMIEMIAVGGLTGLVAGFLGIGGGMILVPLLTLFYPFSIHQAIPISLCSVIASSLGVVAASSRNGLCNIKLATKVEPWALLFGVVGGMTGTFFGAVLLKKIFAIFSLTVAILFLKPKKEEGLQTLSGDGGIFYYRKHAKSPWQSYTIKAKNFLMVIICFGSYLAGLLGIGGGAIIVPSLHVLGHIPIHAATATSSYIMGMSATGGLIYYSTRGDMPWVEATIINVGVLVGSVTSRQLIGKTDSKWVKLAFSGLLIIVAFKMWGFL